MLSVDPVGYDEAGAFFGAIDAQLSGELEKLVGDGVVEVGGAVGVLDPMTAPVEGFFGGLECLGFEGGEVGGLCCGLGWAIIGFQGFILV